MIVQGCRLDAQDDLSRTNVGIGKVLFIEELVRTSMFV
jgi:hypothetical protein